MEPLRTTPTEPILPSIELIRPKRVTWNIHIEAQGNIQPWQEVHISSEVGGLRVLNVLANTGDTVKKGQTLARPPTRNWSKPRQHLPTQLQHWKGPTDWPLRVA
jgi:hypothetical protein